VAVRDSVTRILITAKDEASGVFASLSRNAGKVAAAIAGYFGVKIFSEAITSASEFETQMAVVQSVTRASADELDLLRKAADEAGATTRFTATEAAQALENLARAGLTATESVDALPSVLALAQANAIDLATSSSLVTRAVRGMGLEVSESARVADVLTEAAARANTNVEGLGAALSFAAPTANSLGLTLEDTAAIIGKFADAGIDASRAGTALNSILAQFSNPASKFRQELADAGITTNDFNLALRQLGDAGPRGAKAILAVGQEAGPALRALLNQGIGSLDDLRTALQNAGGAAATAAGVMDNNLDGAVRGLGSAWDALRRTVVAPLLEPIAEQLRGLTARFQAFVADGTAAQFGDAIRSAFEAGATFVRQFIDQINFDQVAEKLRNFASTAGETFDKIGEYAKNTSNVLSVAFGAISTGVDTIKTAFFGLQGAT
jgi:TP901 family phage tail tape measure protein